ncbi:sigma factor-like helix-turn-helix DNA-binding protein [uncultured Planococcus sp.]|uniref:sigma factor-like helix-turn-helix DNA-binding protein n=1 Tax=uncultured Planococcus sp. TaxID=337815 RepID=UPI00260854CA|nr:sigma factor-like helix-turn-helix DNA-binding protein [uncultured Planococcus sp.]
MTATTAKAALQQTGQARATLQAYHALTERQYKGDVDAIVALADLAVAVERAKLTARQAEALRLVYGADMTQARAGAAMGVTREAVSMTVTRATERIQAVYDEWQAKEIELEAVE